jgi:hypothetical protein
MKRGGPKAALSRLTLALLRRAGASGVRQSLSVERRARENAVISSVKVVFGVSGRDCPVRRIVYEEHFR